ncbi:hypothetical protein [Nocardia sp. NPDC052566]|uniref:hypothetical protein n=1 Tax=Nocardia sp. NPDC052566 TaxID=3364330 RepID=UPI0037C9EB64
MTDPVLDGCDIAPTDLDRDRAAAIVEIHQEHNRLGRSCKRFWAAAWYLAQTETAAPSATAYPPVLDMEGPR